MPQADACTWDLADSFAHATVADNVYHNATGTGLSDSFPGSCVDCPSLFRTRIAACYHHHQVEAP